MKRATTLNSQQKFCQLFLMVVLFASLPESVKPFQPHNFRARSAIAVNQRASATTLLKSSLLQHDMISADTYSEMIDVDSSVVIPCLDQWVTLPRGEMMGMVYHSNNHDDGRIHMNDGDIIATSPVEGDVSLLQEGMNVATVSGTEYALLNRATIEMTHHYNYLLENNADGSNEDHSAMRDPPIPTTATKAASSVMMASTEGSTTSSVDTTDPPESQDKAKQLLQKVKDAGVSGAISYALWEFAFWTLSLPVGLVAYRSLTGHWPDLNSTEDWQELGGGAFVFVNLARFAVPIRIGLALSTVPWVQTNLVDRFSNGDDATGATASPAVSQEQQQQPQPHQQQLSVEQIRAMEEYKNYQSQRSREVRQRLEPKHDEPQMSAYEEYEQYRLQRSPELQEQFQQDQQHVDHESLLLSEQSTTEAYQQYLEQQQSPELHQRLEPYDETPQPSAYEEYEQYRLQRSPELQQQFHRHKQIDESLSEESAKEAHEQYLEQRPPELQRRFQQYQSQEEEQETVQEPLASTSTPTQLQATPQSFELTEVEEEVYIS